MTAVDPTRVQEVFFAALEFAPGTRPSFLAEACDGDAALLDEVESLLAHHGDDHTAFSEQDVEAGVLLKEVTVHSAPLTPEPGHRVGRYTIVGPLGMGGMGTVWRAEQDEPHRTVALKMLRPGVTAPELLRRFKDESSALGRLRHPGIAHILEAGTVEPPFGNQPFFAMELVEGESLTEHARRAELDPRARIALIADVCDAVQHAHEFGVVHRDLKPANIVVDATGQPKVLDFGIARIESNDASQTSHHTVAGQLMGTVPYMSPEQVAGDQEAVDARTDVYSLGVILFELLTGRLPYDVARRPLTEAARVIQEHEPSRLGRLDSTFRGDVEVIVEQSLAKEPGRRYASAADLARDLRRFLNDEPIAARPLSTFDHLWRFARRHKAIVGGVGVAFLAVCLGLMISLEQRSIAIENARRARLETVRARIAAAAAALEAKEPMAALENLDAIAEADREWEWHYLSARLDGSVASRPEDPSVVAIGWTIDGSLVVHDDGRLTRGFGDDVKEVGKLKATHIGSAAFSQSGARVAVHHGNDPAAISVFDTASGVRLAHYDDLADAATSISLNPDGSAIAWAHSKDSVFIAAVGSSPRALLVHGNMTLAYRASIAFGPEVLAVAGRYGGLKLYRLSDGKEIAGKRFSAGVRSLAISKDGRQLILGSEDKSIRVLDIPTLDVQSLFTGHLGVVRAVAFGADDFTFYSASEDRTVRRWNLDTQSCEAHWPGHRRGIQQLAVNPTSGHAISRDRSGSLRAWPIAGDEGRDVLRGHSSYVYPVAYSPDGTRIASGSWDGTVRIWDTRSGREMGVVVTGMGKVQHLAWEPGGSRIATSGGTHQVVLIDSAGYTARPLKVDGERHRQIGWSSPGRVWIVVHAPGEGSEIRFLDASDGRVVESIRGSSLGNPATSFSADASLILCETGPSAVTMIDAQTHVRLRTLSLPTNRIEDVALSPDQNMVAVGTEDHGALLVDLNRQAHPIELEGTRDAVRAVAFTRDGRRVITGSHDSIVRIHDVETGAMILALRGHEDYVYSLAVSPDGSQIASGSGDGTVRLWDTRPRHARPPQNEPDAR